MTSRVACASVSIAVTTGTINIRDNNYLPATVTRLGTQYPVPTPSLVITHLNRVNMRPVAAGEKPAARTQTQAYLHAINVADLRWWPSVLISHNFSP